MGVLHSGVGECLHDVGDEHLRVEHHHVRLHFLHVLEGDLAVARREPLADHLRDAPRSEALGIGVHQVTDTAAGPDVVEGVVVES